MKKHLKQITLTAVVLLTAALSSWAGMPAHEGHGGISNTREDSVSHAGHQGKLIHEATVKGYHLSYHLIDMTARMKDMKMAMPPQMGTHHLMIYIQDKDGRPVAAEKVGYLVEGPDGKKQKAMAMGMGNGFGADISLRGSGSYKIHTKIMVGSKIVMDALEYYLE